MKEVLFKNCRIFPSYGKTDILVQNGTIIELSPRISRELPDTYKIDIEDKAVLPSFTDCHAHLSQWGLSRSGPYLGESKNIEECLGIISSFARENEDAKCLIACDFDESSWNTPGEMTKKDLDFISDKTPIIARRICGHCAVANTPALKTLSEKAPALPGFKKEMIDFSTGILKEIPVLRINEIFPPDRERFLSSLQNAIKEMLSMGVTCVGEITSNKARKLILDAEKLPMRFTFAAVEKDFSMLCEPECADELNNVFALKLFLDGSIGARTAAVSFPWLDSPEASAEMLLMKDEEILQFVGKAFDKGKKVWIHAIGDRAISQALDIAELFPAPDRKNIRIEHFELPGKRHIKRAAESSITLSMQPNFIRSWSNSGQLYEKCVSHEFLVRNNPLAEIEKSGCRLCFGSDTMPPGPLWGISGAVNAPFDSQKISLESAILKYTIDSAQSLGYADRGELKKGMKADFILLSDTPKNSNLDYLHVEKVFMDGEKVFG